MALSLRRHRMILAWSFGTRTQELRCSSSSKSRLKYLLLCGVTCWQCTFKRGNSPCRTICFSTFQKPLNPLMDIGYTQSIWPMLLRCHATPVMLRSGYLPSFEASLPYNLYCFVAEAREWAACPGPYSAVQLWDSYPLSPDHKSDTLPLGYWA